MKFIPYSVHTGEKNMAVDEELLDDAVGSGASDIIFRLYGWNPKCISLGRNQKSDFSTGNIPVVRRLTGGRALLHDDEITYSCIAPCSLIPNGEKVTESYKYISKFLIDFFKILGAELDFGENKKVATNFDYCMLISTGADVCYKGKKIIGSAQCRKNGYILQHGSILYSYDKELLEKLFNEEVKGITCVKEILPDLSKERFIELLEQHFLYDMCAETYQMAE